MSGNGDVVLGHQQVKVSVEVKVFKHGTPSKAIARELILFGDVLEVKVALVAQEQPLGNQGLVFE